MMLCPGPLPRRARCEFFRAIWDKKSGPPTFPGSHGIFWQGKCPFPHGSSTSEPALAPLAIPDSRYSSMVLLPPSQAGILLHFEAQGGGTFAEAPSRFGNSPCCFSKSLILAFWLEHTTHFSAAMKINVNKSSAVIAQGQE